MAAVYAVIVSKVKFGSRSEHLRRRGGGGRSVLTPWEGPWMFQAPPLGASGRARVEGVVRDVPQVDGGVADAP